MLQISLCLILTKIYFVPTAEESKVIPSFEMEFSEQMGDSLP